jgi:hypothetical protein
MSAGGRRRVWLGVVLGGALALGALSFSLVRAMEARRGPVLVVRPTAPEEAAPEPGDERRAMDLALASTSPKRRQLLLELMDFTAARLEARLSPLVEDFAEEDGEPMAEFRRGMAVHVPSFTAAREFERARWQHAGLSVRVASNCEDAKIAPDERCIPLWPANDAPSDATVRRARFLSWAASRAAVFELSSRVRSEACARTLRERTTHPDSPVALVLTADDLALRPVPERAALKEAALRLGKVMAANDASDTQHLESFAREPAADEAPIASWLSLSDVGIVVVPRLSAIARPEDLAAEIESAAQGSLVRWIHRPQKWAAQ